MIDSVLKGTGNSRFLKSAVPAGTSWADALAMLQAGTFPIDFNGINAEGFQQVGTPLNKANLLKDATAAQIGLPPSTTPDGMFQALGNTGELHVWRKTVVTKDPVPEVPGSYTLGDAQRLYVATRTFANSSYESYIEGVLASNAITIDLDGKVTLTDPAEVTLYIYNRRDGVTSQTGREAISGYSYFLIPSTSASFIGCEISMTKDTIYYIPSSSSYHRTSSSSGGQSSFDAAQLVTGVPGTPAIPAGTTTTYPVSTNPKAYQEGDDAKAAGYTLGEVVTGTFQFAPNYNTTNAITYQSCSNLQISNDGAVGIDTSDPSYRQVTFKYNTDVDGSDFSNRFVRLSSYAGGSVSPNPQTPFNGTVPSQIVYIPSDTTFDFGSPSTFDRYQPVTGYAAIPAGTTIEYLGKLGDKARVQVVSYVGTGTYGESNPNSLTFDFVPKVVMIQSPNQNTNLASCIALNGSKSVVTHPGRGYASEFSWNKKTVSWYNPDGYQLNDSGKKYIAVAIG